MTYATFFSRLYGYLKPYIGKIIITIVAVIAASILTASLPEITGNIIDELFNNSDETHHNTAVFYSILLFVISFFTALFTLAHIATNSWVSNQVIVTIRQDMFSKILQLPQAYFDQHTTGSILSKITFNVEQISNAASSIWVDFIKSFVMVISLVGYLFYKNWQLSLLLLMLLPLISATIYFSAIRIRKASHAVQQAIGEITHQLNEVISANSLIKLYHAQKIEQEHFIRLSKNIRQQRFKVDMSNGTNALVASIGIGIVLSLVVYFSSVYSNMSAGDFFAFFTAMAILVKPVKSLITINKPLQTALAAGDSVFKFLDEKIEPNTKKSQQVPLKYPVKGLIQFNDLSFGYQKKQAILNHLNLTIESGKTTALVGKTGSGKSTIIQLLCRFYQTDLGNITLDGVNILSLDIEELRQQIAFVDQSVQLFNGTVAQNITLGKPNMSFLEIEQSAKLACASEFIDRLPNGFNAQIGENGLQLSGGQRQRLAIARAIAKQCPILIFDEATSALDNQTEQQVQQAIHQMHGNKTIIIIAHRLGTIKNADKIIVLDKGRVVEQGSHEDLINHNAYYAKLQTQFN